MDMEDEDPYPLVPTSVWSDDSSLAVLILMFQTIFLWPRCPCSRQFCAFFSSFRVERSSDSSQSRAEHDFIRSCSNDQPGKPREENILSIAEVQRQ